MQKNDTVIVLADTGSGKTTRAHSGSHLPHPQADPRAHTEIPQFLVRSSIPCDAPRIVCTQPRRVAATSLAKRVSDEMGTQLGGLVGYTVRFDDRSSRATRLKYATDGALLAEMLADRDLDKYDVVVLDEAHERSLRTDMLMGFLKDIQQRRKDKVRAFQADKGKGKARPSAQNGEAAATTNGANGDKAANSRDPTELKIVVMSATIDAKRFSDFFDKCGAFAVGRFDDDELTPLTFATSAPPFSTSRGGNTRLQCITRPSRSQTSATRRSRPSSRFTTSSRRATSSSSSLVRLPFLCMRRYLLTHVCAMLRPGRD